MVYRRGIISPFCFNEQSNISKCSKRAYKFKTLLQQYSNFEKELLSMYFKSRIGVYKESCYTRGWYGHCVTQLTLDLTCEPYALPDFGFTYV